MKITYPKGNAGFMVSGAEWYLQLNNDYEELYCSFSVKFKESFDFVLGGKLPGLVGGTGNNGGNRPNGLDGWSAQMMWRRSGIIVQYVYHPDQRGQWGDDFYWKKGFLSDFYFAPNVWYTIEHHIKMNTPGEYNGIIEGWLNGVLAIRETNIRFRDTASLGIDAFYFSTFFGGQGPEWAPTRDEYILFDNFIISTKSITHINLNNVPENL